MKKMYKAMLLVLCAMLLVVGSVMGTLAYLQDKTETVTNTMSVGKVEIELDEAKVNLYGEKDGNNRINVATTANGNAYKLIPGHTYVKDPTVIVKAGSEACYLFVRVENGIYAYEDSANTIASQIVSAENGWQTLTGVANVYYKKIENVTSVDTNYPVFKNFTIDKNADKVTGWSDNHEINITAYAIQADGFDTPTAAWTASGFGNTNG